MGSASSDAASRGTTVSSAKAGSTQVTRGPSSRTGTRRRVELGGPPAVEPQLEAGALEAGQERHAVAEVVAQHVGRARGRDRRAARAASSRASARGRPPAAAASAAASAGPTGGGTCARDERVGDRRATGRRWWRGGAGRRGRAARGGPLVRARARPSPVAPARGGSTSRWRPSSGEGRRDGADRDERQDGQPPPMARGEGRRGAGGSAGAARRRRPGRRRPARRCRRGGRPSCRAPR